MFDVELFLLDLDLLLLIVYWDGIFLFWGLWVALAGPRNDRIKMYDYKQVEFWI